MPSAACAVGRVVTYAHVQDVEASLRFYAMLGFAPVSVLKGGDGRAFWAMGVSGVGEGGVGGGDGAERAGDVYGMRGGAEIMFARASGEIDAAQQAVLFYMYSADVRGLREHLVRSGVLDGEKCGGGGGCGCGAVVSKEEMRRGVVFGVKERDYMPRGEVRVHDPDGYVILIGEIG